VLTIVFDIAEALPDSIQRLSVWVLPCCGGVSELAGGECLVLRSGEQLGDDDGLGYRVGGQEAEVEQGVDIGP
jgi:hypothetical protein